jgi:hypothetical protein
MSSAGTRSAVVGPLEILVSPAVDGRSVGLVVVGRQGTPVASTQVTPEAPYVGFSGFLSDGTGVEGDMEATFAGGWIVVNRTETAGPQAAQAKDHLATW